MIVRVTAEFLDAKLCTFPAEERRSFRFFFFFLPISVTQPGGECRAYAHRDTLGTPNMCPADWKHRVQDRISGTLHSESPVVRPSNDLMESTAS